MFFSSSTIRIEAMRIPLASGKLQREAGSLSQRALEVDAAAVSLDHVADDRQPEPGGARLAPGGQLGEALEDLLLLLGRDPGAGVGDRDRDRAVVRRHADAHAPAGRRVADRVGDQVRERPGELRLVAGDRLVHGGAVALERHALLARLDREELNDALDHGAEVYRLPF